MPRLRRRGQGSLCRACSRKVEADEVQTDSGAYVTVAAGLEPLGSSVDMSLLRLRSRAGWAATAPRRSGSGWAATVEQPVKIDNELYVRDYSRCILLRRVEAWRRCAEHVRPRRGGLRFHAHIATSSRHPAGIGVSVLRQLHQARPTGALMFKSSTTCAAPAHGTDEVAGDDTVPVLWRRVHARAPRTGQLHREGPRRSITASPPPPVRQGRFGFEFVAQGPRVRDADRLD
jgi:hypothetical protein